MNFWKRAFQSSVGKKFIMALTGGGLFLFVVGHLVGNLQIFLGPEALNRYGHFLQSNKEIVWPVRLALLALVALHVWSAVAVTAENRAARPVGYAGNPVPPAARYASRTMLMSGVVVGLFVIYHLLHFTVQVPGLNLTGQDFQALRDAQQRHDVYRMMVLGFSRLEVSAFYVLAMGLLCLHLSHGVSAMFQSLGWKNDVYGPLIDRGARVVGWLIFLGYASIPCAVWLRLVQ
jgi:succinate dehydrogenase / fumarate reductase cytochrome b subunit